jgi:TatD DNase family protein
MPRLFDAHNHLQDPRLASFLPEILETFREIGVINSVVNGTQPADWPRVNALAQEYPELIPAFGLHPWHVAKISPSWETLLREQVNKCPRAIGEIGLDRWMKDFDLPSQHRAFAFQLEFAAERELPVSIHCLKAWGPLLDTLKAYPLPRGFLIHSYGGPAEMIPDFVKLGGYFSLSGYFAHERKTRQREAFQSVPLNRLLLETDAPDMLPPPQLQRFILPDPSLNHPANIQAVYSFASELLSISLPEIESQIEENFTRLFL